MQMSAPELAVVSVPSDAHTETNCVYLDMGLAKSIQLIEARGFLFTVKGDPAVAPGTIGMNSIQRRTAGISTVAGHTVTAVNYVPPKPAPAIKVFKLEVEHVVGSRKGGTINVIEFIDYCLKQFANQWFRDGQQFAVIMSSSQKYLCTVQVMAIDDDALGGKAAAQSAGVSRHGQLQPTTDIIITAKEKSEIALTNLPDSQVDSQQPSILNSSFDLENLGIGGLRAEFAQVFRRAFASRIFPQSVVKKLNVKHVKGVLLYGPPGTGKTLIARKIGEILNCRPPKIVNGPEVFNKFVGGTEENVRKLFVDAEAEQASKGDQSQLHLIIFDEFDAICKQRGAVRDSTGVTDNVVNQLLSKIDGVNSLNNVLLIGMTNRKDLIDEAILRPGRFEVHVEIGLPDENGRVEVFRIHTRGMRENHIMHEDVDLAALAKETKNFSGAEIEGVVRSATSQAFNRHIDFEHPAQTIDASAISVRMADFKAALKEITPAFGQAKDECEGAMPNGIIAYGPKWRRVQGEIDKYVQHLQGSRSRIDSLAVLLSGECGCGKSAVAAHLALHSGFPYVKFLTPDNMVSYGEAQKSNLIRKAFEDAYKSPLSVIVLDDIERLIEYSELGSRYSNVLLQTLLVLIKRPPPAGKKLMIIGTTSLMRTIRELELASCFSVSLNLPLIERDSLSTIAQHMNVAFKSAAEEQQAIALIPEEGLPIKKVILTLEMAASDDLPSTPQTTSGAAAAVDAKNKLRHIEYKDFADAVMSATMNGLSY